MIMEKREIILFQLIFLLVVFLANNSPVFSQYGPTTLTGPRLGFTIISGEMADKLKDDYDAIPIVTQFGWQFEWRFFSLEDGTSGVVEIIPLVGGVEQNLFLPSLSVLIGIRSKKGLEFGVGPNVSITGFAIAFAGGVTVKTGQLNWPINIAYVPSTEGARLTFLFGFNMIIQ